MEKFTRLTATACPLDLPNIDTDQLLPARYLKVPRASGLGPMLLRDLRFDADGGEKEFPLNTPAWRGARIVVAPGNFGVGSSREAAVYALVDYGIRCVIAPSFGDIFAGNSVQNGLLTARVSPEDAQAMIDQLMSVPATEFTVDLEARTILGGSSVWTFAVDATVRTRLLNGWDDIDITRSYQDRIAAFRKTYLAQAPGAVPAH
jgi:3-isopropylmalate/(R)-2-methylmalate dehydratase small subunit